MTRITALDVVDVRFPTSRDLDGSDAMNPEPDYSAAYVVLRTDDADVAGYSLLFTTGRGNDVACAAVRALDALRRRTGRRRAGRRRRRAGAGADLGRPAALARPGEGRHAHGHRRGRQRRVGPALPPRRPAAVAGARRRCHPRRSSTRSTSPTSTTRSRRRKRWSSSKPRRRDAPSGSPTLEADGLPAYTTSAGWLGYDDDKVERLVRQSVADGFTMLKLKVGADVESDIRRLGVARRAAGERARIAVDANQRWGVGQAIEWMAQLARVRPVLDRGADLTRRRPRPPRHPRGGAPDPGGDRRARPEPGDLQAAAPGRGDRRRADRRLPGRRRQREPRHPAARGQVRRAGVPARRRRRAVRDGAAPGDVRLRRRERDDRRPVDRVRRPPPRALHRSGRRRAAAATALPPLRAAAPGCSTTPIAEFRFPDGPAWIASTMASP